ncbi:MAG TPA: tRNA threonylcarbamoyladenosine dehydratase [Porphyromonadaceae bacterium]|nr:tRNA threonylcarbamoyladenosine dehydratase [Porphyromonadaceae bacterium]
MTNWSERTELLLGNERVNYLKEKHVLVVGLGGVGAYAAEMICRAGIGKMTIIDADKVNASNINRQLPATHATLGQLKADVMAQRLRDINPDIELNVIAEFIKDEKIPEILESAKFDYVVDAIDSLSPKVYLIYNAYKMQLPIVSSMGAGGKIDPSQVKIADISKSHNCALAKAVRKRLNRLDVRKGIPVVFSTEFADENAIVKVENEQNKISTAGTISYLPAIFGCYLASYVIRNI